VIGAKPVAGWLFTPAMSGQGPLLPDRKIGYFVDREKLVSHWPAFC
jgi:hypothetical protein